jgi:hypothetical protein
MCQRWIVRRLGGNVVVEGVVVAQGSLLVCDERRCVESGPSSGLKATSRVPLLRVCGVPRGPRFP